MLALVLAQVEDFKGAVVLALGLQLPLHADQPLARGVDGELAQVGDDPLAPQLLRHCRRRAGAAEEIGDKSPSLEEALMMRSSRASGFWVG